MQDDKLILNRVQNLFEKILDSGKIPYNLEKYIVDMEKEIAMGFEKKVNDTTQDNEVILKGVQCVLVKIMDYQKITMNFENDVVYMAKEIDQRLNFFTGFEKKVDDTRTLNQYVDKENKTRLEVKANHFEGKSVEKVARNSSAEGSYSRSR